MFVLKTSVLFLGLVAFGFGSFFSPRDDQSCPQQGLTCKVDCSSMMYCKEQNDTGTSLEECTAPNMCEVVNGIPSCEATSCPTILCGAGTTGGIPSPFNCSRYFVCDTELGNATDQSSCPANQYYNTVTQNCTEDPCDREEGKCEKAGETGSLDNYMYVCLGPDQFLIIKNNDSSTPTSTTTEPPYTCTGPNQKFPDPADCHSYYICLGQAPNFNLTHRTCPNGTIYDSAKFSCIKGNC